MEGTSRWWDPGCRCLAAIPPDRAGESAQEGDKPGVGRVCCGVPRDSVVGDAKASLVVRLVQAHVDPSAVLQVPFLVVFAGAFQQGIGDLVVDMLLL